MPTPGNSTSSSTVHPHLQPVATLANNGSGWSRGRNRSFFSSSNFSPFSMPNFYFNSYLTFIFSLCFLTSTLTSAFVLEGSDTSYAKFRKWNCGLNATLLLEFNTGQPDGVLLYTDDGGNDDFFELKLVEGGLRLRYNLGDGTQVMTVGRHLNDGLWHRAEIRRNSGETSLTVDGFVTQSRVSKGRDLVFGNMTANTPLYVGGLPSWYNNRLTQLSLPSVVFEPRFRGAFRNLVYSSEDSDVPKPQDIIEYKGLVSGPGEACERHDPCQHGGFCISTDSGPVCDCKHIDFEGAFCERGVEILVRGEGNICWSERHKNRRRTFWKESSDKFFEIVIFNKAPAEATFHGGEYIGYDFGESGGKPIVSTLDEVSFFFKTRHGHGLLFYSGDGADYLALALREGRITISINLGSGPLDAKIHPDHVRFDDNEWHSVRIHRKVQEITASVDGIHFDRWTLAGSFTLLSSNRVTVGGFDAMRPLDGIRAVTNFIGCLKKVEYRADTLRLSLLELARSGNRLVSVSGRLQFQCQDPHTGDPVTFHTSDSYLKTMSGGTVTFTSPDSFLVLPSWNASRSGSLSVKVRTTEPNGLILFASGSSDGQGDFFAIEMVDGQIYLHLDLGTGSLRVPATTDSIADGEWHQIALTRNGRSGSINVDDVATDFNTKGESTRLDLDGLLYIGGLGNLDHYSLYPVPIWTASLRKGFVGCVRGLVINGTPIDLAAIAQQQDIGSVRPLCQVGSAGQCVSNPCQHGGKCLDGWNRFICDCSHTDFTGPTCAKNAATLSFDATQFIQVSYGIPLKIEAQDITLRFRTNRHSGLLLAMGSTSSADILELSLESTRVKLRVRLGDREKMLLSGRDLNDNQWHLVRINRRGNHLRVQVDDIPPVNGEVLSRTWPLEVTHMFIGGTFYKEHEVKVPTSITPFAGHMQQLIMNSQHIFEMIRVGQIDNVEMTAKFGKTAPIVDKPVTFKSKHTFVGLPQLKAYSQTNIYFQFKTLEPDGLIIYNGGKSQDFIAIEMVKGHLHYVFDLGDGPFKLRDNSRQPLNDNRWHTVTIGRPNSKQHTLMVDESLSITATLGPNQNLDLNGILYLGGVPEHMYDNLPRVLQSRYGFVGCLASLDLGGEALNPTADALVPSNMVVAGCEDANERCTSDSCSNGGLCVEQWSGPGCDCDMTSYTGPTCAQESISYDFGPGRGVILFTYPEERRPDTRGDSVAFGFLTADPDAVLLRIDSARSTDYLEIELMDGKVKASYNMGTKEHTIGELTRKVNDRTYHVVRFTRAGPNSTLQLDNWDMLTKYPIGNHELSIFNGQSVIHVGGHWRATKRVVDRPFQGVMSGMAVNGLRPLDMATERDRRVGIIGDVHQITSIGSIPSSSLKDDIRYMQKTTASGTPGVMDDLVYSGDRGGQGCNMDDEDECVPVFDTGSGDDLITPVYVPTPTRSPSTTSTRRYGGAQRPGGSSSQHPVPCDDEDCVPGSGLGSTTEDDITTIPGVYTFGSTTTDHSTSTFFHSPTSSRGTTTSSSSGGGVVSGVPGGENGGYPHVTTEDSSSSTRHQPGGSTTINYYSPTYRQPPTSTRVTTTSSPTTTPRFIPPPLPTNPPDIPKGRVFDFENGNGLGGGSGGGLGMPGFGGGHDRGKNETILHTDTGDSTLIIIIIIAVLMIIIVSILIIFFMCKRRDDPIYKIEDKGRYEYVPSTTSQPAPFNGRGGQRKPGVKEWYV